MHTIRKPRVFLSHSKRDIEFIRRLESDLRACQCEPWIDEIEIRHGKPWLDEIFASGIPSCEILLCYVTENSLESTMVQQEIDVRLLERLQNDRVTLLLYVNSSESRSKLRLDLQRLQIPMLNSENYTAMLPSVVAAIWQSYTEHFAAGAVQSERVKRLEAEIKIRELEASSSKDIFTTSEAAEFSAIWARLDREVSIGVGVVKKESRVVGGMGVIGERTESNLENTTHQDFSINVGGVFLAAVVPQKFQPSHSIIHDTIERDVLQILNLSVEKFEANFDLPVDFDGELLRYGLVERQPVPSEIGNSLLALTIRPNFRVVFTSKFDRFAFWIDHNFGAGAVKRPIARLRQ